MPRYKPYDYNQLMMVPVSLEEQLVAGTLEHAIHHLIEERVDTSVFDAKYRNEETRRTAYAPKVLLKIVLFAYSRRQPGRNLPRHGAATPVRGAGRTCRPQYEGE